MDTTTSTFGGGDEQLRTNYVSCIKVDGVPILPPLMTEERRREMKSFKELAILKEKELREKKLAKLNAASATVNYSNIESSPHLSPVESRPTNKLLRQGRSSSTSPPAGVPATSTPRTPRFYSRVNTLSSTGTEVGSNIPRARRSETFSCATELSSTSTSQSLSDVPERVLRERKIDVAPLDLNKSGSSDPSSVMSYDADEEKEVASMDSHDNSSDGSDDNFASAASSAGTFVIRKGNESQAGGTPSPQEDHPVMQGGQITTSEDELDNENAPPTVLRKPKLSEEGMFKRKRPAKYFDDDEGNGSAKSSVEYSSIPHRVVQEEQRSDSKRLAPVAGSPLTFSSVPHTNFSMLAKSLTNEFSQKFCANLASSSSAATLPTVTIPATSNAKRSTEGSYNVTLSKDIPSSAEENLKSDSDDMSNGSDKENRDMTGGSGESKFVRKLSYTLATPSAALLDAVSRDKNFVQTLDTVPSEASSIGIPSNAPTPVKTEKTSINPASTPLSLRAASNVDLDHEKKAHLERYLGDQEDQAKLFESLLTKMQHKQEAALHQLAEQHRLQEQRIKQQFQSELEKIRENLSSTFNTTNSGKSFKSSPASLLDFVSPSPVRSPRPLTGGSVPISGGDDITTSNSQKMITSGMSGISISERTRSGTSIYQFTGGMGGMNSNSAAGAPVSAVGLSKLQSKMQLMSPGFFRTPADGKSPLLKGLIFPDPLDKPQLPVRIPPKAFEASMKVKFDKISAAVKGYLTRRLLNTEKVQVIIQTIRDTVDLVFKLHAEDPMSSSLQSMKPQDSELHKRLILQLTGTCRSFHDVFFKLSTKERMAIIATDREKQKAKAMRAAASPSKPNISNATLKSIERRMSHSHSSRTSPMRDNRKSRVSKIFEEGSHSAKPKPIKSFNISPKRRRISYWEDGRSMTRSTTFASQQDLNGNNFKTPMSSARSQISSSSSARSARSRNQPPMSAGIGDTFIVSSSSRGYMNSGNGKSNQNQATGFPRRESTSRSATVSSSSRSSQAAAVSGMSGSMSRPKGSSARQAWNAVRN